MLLIKTKSKTMLRLKFGGVFNVELGIPAVATAMADDRVPIAIGRDLDWVFGNWDFGIWDLDCFFGILD